VKLVTIFFAALMLAAASGAAAAAEGACSSECGFVVSPSGFRAFGAGADGKVLNARVGARVVWRLERRALGQRDAHTVSSDDGFFRSPLLRNTVGDAVFWRRTTSAGIHRFHDSVGRAGSGTLIVLPTLKSIPGGVRATWAARGSNVGNAYAIRYQILRELDVVGKGWIWGRTATLSRSFQRGSRLGGVELERGLILCIEARSGLIGEGWSDWARNCVEL
jgi:hypothetical protein